MATLVQIFLTAKTQHTIRELRGRLCAMTDRPRSLTKPSHSVAGANVHITMLMVTGDATTAIKAQTRTHIAG